MPEPICVAFTGASGMPYGLRLVECLLAAGRPVQLLYSQAAQIVARQELALELPSRPHDAEALLRGRFATHPELLTVYGREEWFAPVASGSNSAGGDGRLPVFYGHAGGNRAGPRRQADRTRRRTSSSRKAERWCWCRAKRHFR